MAVGGRRRQTHADCAVVSLASNHHGSWRLTIFRRCLLPSDPFPNRLPLQAPEGQLHHSHLPPQHQLKRQHLFGHSARPMEPSSHHLKGYAMLKKLQAIDYANRKYSATEYLLDVDRPEP
jgi:hypothetical protein